MRKQELVHLHALCVLLRDHLEERHEVPAGVFRSYDDCGVSPTALDRRKAAHEEAVVHAADDNARFLIYDDDNAGYTRLHRGGTGWGNYPATGIAFGDVDGDGRDEVAVCRFANENARYWLYDDRDANFGQMACGGYGWGSPYHATGVAIGNATGAPNIEPTVGVTRKADRNARYWIHEVNL